MKANQWQCSLTAAVLSSAIAICLSFPLEDLDLVRGLVQDDSYRLQRDSNVELVRSVLSSLLSRISRSQATNFHGPMEGLQHGIPDQLVPSIIENSRSRTLRDSLVGRYPMKVWEAPPDKRSPTFSISGDLFVTSEFLKGLKDRKQRMMSASDVYRDLTSVGR